jgi:ATP-dependent protease ClpP protease subunit
MSIQFLARGARSAEIWLYGVVGDEWGGITDKQFVKNLNDLGRVDEINLRINSEGGSVMDGYAIYNALVRHPAKISVDIDAFAGSIASIIAMSGDTISMASNAMMMIHDPTAGVWGNAIDMRRMADILDGIRGKLIDTYVARTKNSSDEISKWMTDETWLSAEQAVTYGFADSITQELKIAAYALSRDYKHRPKNFVVNEITLQKRNRDIAAVRVTQMRDRLRKVSGIVSE